MSSPEQKNVFTWFGLVFFFFLYISNFLLWNQQLIPYEIHDRVVEDIV